MQIEDIIARLRVEGDDEYASKLDRARGVTRETGEATEEAGAQSKRGAAGMLKAAAGAAVLYKGFKALKGAVNTTQQLAKDTSAFARSSGLSKTESQAWVVVAQQRGIATKQLQVGMATLGRNLGALGKPTKSSAAMFDKLGVSQNDLLKLPMEQRMASIADAFSKIPDGANKAALAQRIFGRAGQQLLPVLNEGGDAMTEQLQAANALVPPLGKTGKAALDMAKQQRTMKMAMTGVQVAVGSALVPILSKLSTTITPIITRFSQLLGKSPQLTTAIIGLAGALVAMMVVNKLNAVLTTFKNVTLVQAAASKIAAAAQWLWNAALSANPIGLVVIALVALGAGLVLAYQKVGWFRNMVNGAFNAIKTVVGAVVGFIKANWRIMAVALVTIMLGPLAGVAAAFFLLRDKVNAVTGAIKSAFTSAKNWIVGQLGAIASFAKSIPGKIGSALSSLAGTVKRAFTSAFSGVAAIMKAPINAVIGAWNGLRFTVPKVKVGPVSFGGQSIGVPRVPQLAAGGVIRQAGLALVGERGPEIASFPRGARVSPLPAPEPEPVALASGTAPGDPRRPIIVKTYLQHRQIGEAMASYAGELQAAR